MSKHKVGIIGASGYTGYELIKILSKHKFVELIVLNSENHKGKKVKDLYTEYDGEEKFTNYSIDEINNLMLDILFLAVPHGVAKEIVQKVNCKVIDLSPDFRFSDVKLYEKAYGEKLSKNKLTSVYGLPELFKEKIKNAKIIGNPGCYSTGMILSAYPIQNKAKYIVFDCKSGWSGAGKESVYAKDSCLTKNNIIAYKLTAHRHKYEVMQFIKTKLSFTPHVIDTFQGMMITAHILLKKKEDAKKIIKIYMDFYKNSAFVEILESIPDLHSVQNTNKVLIGGFEIDENNQLVIVAVLDNLLKGASGHAVQNMNIMLGINEKEGLS